MANIQSSAQGWRAFLAEPERIAAIGVLWFNEPVAALQIVSLVAIIGRVVGLYLSGGVH
jgi:hypothetical protein